MVQYLSSAGDLEAFDRSKFNDYSYVVESSRLCGKVQVSGAKNSALRLLAASLLTSDPITLTNFPVELLDGKLHIEMLEKLGKKCILGKDIIEIIEERNIKTDLIWYDRSIRNTLLILGALLSREKKGAVPLPGGCKIGERKFDIHEMIFRKMGADVWIEDNHLYAEAKQGLIGCEIYLPIRSTGATENGIICGTLAKGVTNIWNPHIRPEILDLISMLKQMGAIINIYGQERIEVRGVEGLNGACHKVIPDNMEAITWLIASVITNGEIEIVDFPFEHLEVPMVFLRESGARYFKGENSLIARGGKCFPIDISTGTYPGINSDMQPLFAIFGACAKGESRIIDLRFPGRYKYTDELKSMGVECFKHENLLKIIGGNELKGAEVSAIDLRAGVALTLSGLVARGVTVIHDAWQIERGYNNFVQKLDELGANINISCNF